MENGNSNNAIATLKSICVNERSKFQTNTMLEDCLKKLLAITESGRGTDLGSSSYSYGSRCLVTFDEERRHIKELLGFVLF